jgi:phage terminase small subunit
MSNSAPQIIEADSRLVRLKNPRHQAFAEHYLLTGSATQAAVFVKYSKSTAGKQGPQMLAIPEVAQYIAARREKLRAKTDISRESIINELRDLAFFNIKDITRVDKDGQPILDLSNTTRDQFKAISKISTRSRTVTGKNGEVTTERLSSVTIADKYRGLELLGKTLGIFQEPEQRVTIDVADRLLAARNRVQKLTVIDEVLSGDS